VIAGDVGGIGGGGDAAVPSVSAELAESAGGEPKKGGGDQLPGGGAATAAAQGRGGTLLHRSVSMGVHWWRRKVEIGPSSSSNTRGRARREWLQFRPTCNVIWL
jgi:hypothetical protein